MRKIFKLKGNGFCYGVTRAIKIANDVLKDPNTIKPIYMLGSLIHNQHVNEYLKSKGIIVLDNKSRFDLLDEISSGTVIFTAHGVSDQVINKAVSKGLNYVDATCPYVKKMFSLVKNKINDGCLVYFIGKDHHPESEVALSLGKNVTLIDKNNLPSTDKLVYLCHQTTMSSFDIEELYQLLINKNPNLTKLDMLCKVTEERQLELLNLNKNDFSDSSLIIIIGDKMSNNSTKLYEIAKRINKPDVLFISNISELNLLELKKYDEIRLISGTSTPAEITNEIYNVLLDLDSITYNKYVSKLNIDDYIK